MIRSGLALLSLLFACVPARAADVPTADASRVYGSWRSSRIGGGGWVQHVANTPADANRFYAYVDMAGVYRSDDGAKTWRMMHAGLPASYGGYEIRGILTDPRNADQLLVAIGNNDWAKHRFGLYKSVDGGVTYREVLDALFVGNGVPHRDAGFILARHPQQPDVVLVGTFGEGVYRSEDSGDTWTDAGLKDLMVTDVRFDSTDGNRVWLCAQPWTGKVDRKPKTLQGGFYFSKDGGRSWERVSEESPTEVVQDSAKPDTLVGIFGNSELRRSDDAGRTWTGFSEGLPVEPDKSSNKMGVLTRSTFRVLAAGPDFFITGNRVGDVFRRDRNDAEWREVKYQRIEAGDWWGNTGDKPGWVHFGKAFGSLWIDPADPKHWMRTDWFAIWATRDAGNTWTYACEGFEQTVPLKIMSSPDDSRIVHLVMADNGYFRSDDGGRSFQKVDKGQISAQLRDVVVSPASPSRVYTIGAALATSGEWVCNQLFVSDDAGVHWQPAAMKGLTGPETRRCVSVAVDPADASRMFLALAGPNRPGEGGPYVSTDAGENFTWMGQGLPEGKPLFRHAFWSTGTELAATTEGRLLATSRLEKGVYSWDPKKNSWSNVTPPGGGYPIHISADPTTPGRILVSFDGKGLFLSEDEGVSWTQTFKGPAQQHAFDPKNPGIVAAMAMPPDAGALLSRDGGKTWTPLDPSLPMRLGLTFAFSDGRLLVGTHGAGVFEYLSKP